MEEVAQKAVTLWELPQGSLSGRNALVKFLQHRVIRNHFVVTSYQTVRIEVTDTTLINVSAHTTKNELNPYKRESFGILIVQLVTLAKTYFGHRKDNHIVRCHL